MTNANTNSEFISDLKKRNAKITKLFTIFEKFYMGNGRTDEEKESAREKLFNGIGQVTTCKRFGCFDKQLVQCKQCKGSTQTMAKIQTMCKQFAAEKAETEKAEREAKKKEKVALDQYGFRVNSKISKVVELMSKQPLKMADIKKVTGDSYYNTAKRKPEVFGCTENGYWYIKGTHSEALAKEIEAQLELEKGVLAELKAMSDNF